VAAEPLFERLCLIGVGLIGSSIARAARAKGGIARSIVGFWPDVFRTSHDRP
jgi:cyclohexadieny/prephenate dehydrogenase